MEGASLARQNTLYIALAAVIIVVVLAGAYFLLAGRGEGEVQEEATPTETTPTAGEAAPKEEAKVIEINVGLLVAETGPTSDVGKGYARGAEAAFKYFNEKGIYTKDGVRVKINYIKRDYAYNPTLAEEFYREFRDRYNVIAVVGWGTADTEKLSDQVARDKVVYISASYSAKLVVKPYNFFPAPDYSTQACSGLQWLATEYGAGKIALAYDHKVAYSRSPISAIKEAAKALGMEVVGDFDLPLRATEADAERIAREMKAADPDYVWCGNTISSCSLLARAMAKVGLDAVLLSNVWGFDERSPNLVGEEAYGMVAGISPFLYPMFASGVEAYNVIYEAASMAGVPKEEVTLRFVQGFLNVWLLVKAIEEVTSQDLLERKGEALKEVLESRTFDFGGITAAPLRFQEGWHVPYKTVFIVFLAEDGSLQLKGKFTAPEAIDCAKVTIEGG